MYQELNNLINFLENKKILIAGFGREGKSTYNFLQKYVPSAKISIGEQNKIDKSSICSKTPIFEGENYLSCPDNFDLMIKTPGISLLNIPQNWLFSEKITSQTELILRFFGEKTKAVTGTKGKSTTTTLINHLLCSSGIKTMLAGNMGLPFFDEIVNAEDKVIVAELSSHQLETTNYAPKIAVLLNIFPEHLDHYKNFEEYAKAKWNIAIKQNKNSKFFIPQSCINEQFWTEFQKQCISEVCCFGTEEDMIFFKTNSQKQKIKIDIDKIKLKGKHNLLNISASVAVSICYVANIDKIIESIYSFTPLPHRLEFVREWNGITFINDSISTIPQSAIAAINTFDTTETIILGGFNRNIDYSELVNFITNSKIENIILMGDVGKVINEGLKNNTNSKKIYFAENMQSAVQIAASNTSKGKVCLLSPAASSYDKYINFEYRGNDFKKIVNAL